MKKKKQKNKTFHILYTICKIKYVPSYTDIRFLMIVTCMHIKIANDVDD